MATSVDPKRGARHEPDIHTFEHHWQDEADAAYLYRILAAAEPDAKKKDIYARLADVEDRHVVVWGDLMTSHGHSPKPFKPSAADQNMLLTQLSKALAGVKSCTFDLGADNVKVDLSRPDLVESGRVVVNGTAVPFDPANGWSMASETIVTLAGAACDTWRDPTVATSISFDFPCDIFIPR